VRGDATAHLDIVQRADGMTMTSAGSKAGVPS
jgi:hypothetical protein